MRIRPEIAALAAYRQGKPAPADAYKLSANENPFEPIPAVREAIAAASVNRYPDGSAVVVRQRIAERHGVTVGEVHVGAGSVAVLQQIVLAAASVGDEVVFAWRSFEAYPGLVAVAGATAVPVPLTASAEHDLDAMADAVTEATRLVIVCSPNNPTGTVVTATAFAAFMQRIPPTVLVVLDEAYVEFVTDPAAVSGEALLLTHPNLIVLRTFSKAYGLAGLRFGYAIGPEWILDALRAVAIPLSVVDAAQRAAIAALDNEEQLLERVGRLSRLRDQVRLALIDQGWWIPEAQGNFVWLATGAHTAQVAEIFLAEGIVTRPLGHDGVRVSIGESQAVDKLLRAAQEVVRTLPTAVSRPGLD